MNLSFTLRFVLLSWWRNKDVYVCVCVCVYQAVAVYQYSFIYLTLQYYLLCYCVGFGTYVYENKFFQYEGEWLNGKKHGGLLSHLHR